MCGSDKICWRRDHDCDCECSLWTTSLEVEPWVRARLLELRSQSPNILARFVWEKPVSIISETHIDITGIPRIFAPKAYAIRDRCIHALKIWQEHARGNFTSSAIGPDGDDEFWGSRSFRERNAMSLEMDGFAPEHTAHSNLSFLWA